MALRKKRDYTKLQSITECDICDMELSDPRRIECGHIFCLRCLRKHVDITASCPTCKRHMQPKSGNVENYPVAVEIVHLLQSLQKVASHIEGEEAKEKDKDEDQYEDVDADQHKLRLPSQSSTTEPTEVCDIHRENLAFVCETCDDELICAKCIIHSKHKKLEISEHAKHLEKLLDKQKGHLLKREKDDKAEEEKLQDMIEKQIEQKEIIKEEIEEIAEEMFAEIHRKKEDMLQPIETRVDEYVKHLTERQEHIKDSLSEFNHVSNRIVKLSNDGTTDFCRKAKRLVKQTEIALQVENKPVPKYQTIEFSRNRTAIEYLSKLNLGDVEIQEVLIDPQEEYDTSDFSGFEEPYDNGSTPRKAPPPPIRPKPKKLGKLEVTREESEYCTSNFEGFEELSCDESPNSNPLPTPVKPKQMKDGNIKLNREENANPNKNLSLSSYPRCPPPLPPRPHISNPNPSSSRKENIYIDMDESLYHNTMGKARHQSTPHMEEGDQNQGSFIAPPPLSPFSGSFRISISVANDNRAFPQRVIHRVFLPFRPSGFTVVQGYLETYYAFVTDGHDVKLFKQNGELHRTISDLTNPFDVASQQRGETLTPLYITDEGKRTGNGSVRVYSSDGKFQKVLVGKLRKPRGISISRVGLVYVCDEANILVLCPTTGKKKRVISSIGRDPLFVFPMYVMVSATGKILVSDVGTRELKIHDETRKYTDKFSPDGGNEVIYTSFCPGMCSEDSSSNYYVIDQERNILYMLRGGGRSEKLELPEKPKGHDGIPTVVAFDPNTGNIVVF